MTTYELDHLELGFNVANALEMENLKLIMVRPEVPKWFSSLADWYKRTYLSSGA